MDAPFISNKLVIIPQFLLIILLEEDIKNMEVLSREYRLGSIMEVGIVLIHIMFSLMME